MANEYTEFWKQLLQAGKDEEERRNNWNRFCIDELQVFSILNISSSKKEELLERYDPWHRSKFTREISSLQDKQIDSLRELVEKHDGPKRLPGKKKSGNFCLDFSSFMDFSDVQVEGLSFDGRIFIGADFQKIKFDPGVNFEGSVFLGSTHFDNAIFSHEQHPIDNSFKNTEFRNTASFKTIKSANIRFDGSTFHSDVYFDDANFAFGRESRKFATFDHCHFNGEVKFPCARFDYTGFNGSQFEDTASFAEARFGHKADFSNVQFKYATSFRRTVFQCPPKFYDAELHEDTNFDGVDWHKAENAYTRPSQGGPRSTSIRENAADAVRAWDRLILIMIQREKHVERHEFFCLKMRAQRIRDGNCLLSLANWLFDIFSGYGWNVRRAVGWWMAHMAIGAILIFCGISYSPESNRWWQFVESFGLSFANAHAFLGLASKGGYLYDVRTGLDVVIRSDGYLDWIGAFQVAIGPVFLFLVLLTVRNRFRIR